MVNWLVGVSSNSVSLTGGKFKTLKKESRHLQLFLFSLTLHHPIHNLYNESRAMNSHSPFSERAFTNFYNAHDFLDGSPKFVHTSRDEKS